MTELLIFFAVGLMLGAGYMFSLSWTVQRLDKVEKPKRFLMLTALARFIVAGCVFYYVLQKGVWYAVFATLLGFIVTRTVFVWTRKTKKK